MIYWRSTPLLTAPSVAPQPSCQGSSQGVDAHMALKQLSVGFHQSAWLKDASIINQSVQPAPCPCCLYRRLPISFQGHILPAAALPSSEASWWPSASSTSPLPPRRISQPQPLIDPERRH